MTINELVGKRCLLQIANGTYNKPEVDEYRVLEIAPSGNWVKLQNIYGRKFWRPVVQIAMVEELVEFKTKPSAGQ